MCAAYGRDAGLVGHLFQCPWIRQGLLLIWLRVR
jgi:hypothetical protein